jgi:hypothetical protein
LDKENPGAGTGGDLLLLMSANHDIMAEITDVGEVFHRKI